ncbi:MAG: ABC transporter ATP-binding protein [Tyzzerella sp.]|uniref:ABC-type quaternary amine transporter n=1 Tax=Candidatus Fimicola merdigallinarum TaxID=2840819 RepID=A0A9D9DXN2_9FIRM|nr:ABC transporter ATP-binding protein [Candidatus Fimicola merdigallinarum]
MLEFRDVTFRYKEDDDYIMKNLNFKVEKGQFVSIIGPSGCGKSTIFRLLNGLEKPESGEILVDGKDISTLKDYCAFMPQKDLLFPWRTIEENISLPMEIKKVPKKERHKKCVEVLKEVGLLDYINKYPRDLSGGMKQRVSFGRTILTGSDILLLDEPFSALDYLTRMDMQEWILSQWRNLKKTIIFITHDVEEALFLSDTIYIINEKPFCKMDRVDIGNGENKTRDFLKQEEIISLKERLINNLRLREGRI